MPLTLGVAADLGPGQIEAFLRMASEASPLLLMTVLDGCEGDARLASEELRCEDELFLPIWDELFVLALPVEHPLACHDALDMDALTWITCPSHASHQRILALHGEGGTALACAARAGSLTLALRMVAAGMGVALLPQSLIEGREDVVFRPLSGPSLTRRIGLCYSAQALNLPAVAVLHAYLQRKTAPV